jgi:tRNA (cmo5U34)-methyltransferase
MTDFSFETIENFNKHIALSIPQYDWALKQVVELSEYFIEDNTFVYDLGCSEGQLFSSYKIRPSVSYRGLDNCENLLSKAEGLDLGENVEFNKTDLVNYQGYGRSSFMTSIFTLQFLPRETRRHLLERVSRSLLPGGAFISCEKVYSDNALLQDATNSLYYDFKRASFPTDEILDKEKSLRSLAKLQGLKKSIDDLSVIGEVEMFWRCYNFVGLIAIKN